jgi:hypothetical protein
VDYRPVDRDTVTQALRAPDSAMTFELGGFFLFAIH